MREVKLLQSVTMSLYPVLQRHMKVTHQQCVTVTKVDYVIVTMSLVELENYLCGQRQYLVFSSRARRLLCCSVSRQLLKYVTIIAVVIVIIKQINNRPRT